MPPPPAWPRTRKGRGGGGARTRVGRARKREAGGQLRGVQPESSPFDPSGLWQSPSMTPGNGGENIQYQWEAGVPTG